MCILIDIILLSELCYLPTLEIIIYEGMQMMPDQGIS